MGYLHIPSPSTPTPSQEKLGVAMGKLLIANPLPRGLWETWILPFTVPGHPLAASSMTVFFPVTLSLLTSSCGLPDWPHPQTVCTVSLLSPQTECPGLVPLLHQTCGSPISPAYDPAHCPGGQFSFASPWACIIAGAREPPHFLTNEPQNKPCGQKVTSTEPILWATLIFPDGKATGCLCPSVSLSFILSLERQCWVMRRMCTLSEDNYANPSFST